MTDTTARAFSPSLIIALGCLIAMIAFGVRSTGGLFAVPMIEANGWNREIFGMAFAIQNLAWGIMQPIAGAFADKLGSVRVVMFGAVVYGAGVVVMALSETALMLNLGAGILMGIGIATTSFSIIMPAFARLVPPEKRSWAFGMATAATSAGQLVFAPLGHAFISAFGWQTALFLLAIFLALIIPLVLPFRAAEGGGRHQKAVENEPEFPLPEVVKLAFGHGSFVLLVFGFFVCGFHVAFIAVHLPAYIEDLGLDPSLGAWSIATIGFFNIIGAYTAGIFGSRYSKRFGLSFIYLARAFVIAIFIATPISAASVLVFAAAMGLLWLSTIPLTIGLVTVMFGTRYMAMLYGFVFVSHQVGSFLGVWLGGRFYDQYGNYDMIWYAAIFFGIASAIVHWPIRETLSPRFATTPAQ
ncbi:MAG: MFS transporter [Hyphomicrobiales bacterium]|nr:MFS transporter [Hyphomicrobiales bacterium]